jgi:hypothetical protein
MSGATEQQVDWVGRVLGVRTDDGAQGAQSWPKAIAAWRAANEVVDRQISALQAVLKDSGDPELAEIAEYGLGGVAGGFKVPLMAVMQDIEKANGAPAPALLSRLGALAEKFRAHLETSDRVRACDENPFGIAMNLRQTLGGALGEIQATLRARS